MKSGLRIALLFFLVSGTLTEDGFDLFDALDDTDPTPAKPKEPPKPPSKPGDDGLDLLDAFDFGPTPAKPKEKPKPPSKPKDDDGLDLFDALGPDLDPKPDKPPVNPPPSGGGGGGSFDDSDLLDVGGGEYKPDGGRSGGGGASDPGHDPGYDPNGGADQPQEAGGGQIAGIVSAVGVAILGAASSYIAYQKKKLCFKLQGGQDPESGKGPRGGQNDNQLFSNLLRTS
ncbi:CD99 antigen-like protein 2 isoform X1 [Xyrichtys novacula]|uniref:CD99 antigen-like protein 2 isoform X1 n=1 Tax=Xyrichtys novacula TaxID=13765 RepID=A0AAV1HMH6_XYRNO|nr:CD99 antigen-like protein 2 isoform X1 [Xyrichtys novacula]